MYICILIKSVKQNALILCLHQVHPVSVYSGCTEGGHLQPCLYSQCLGGQRKSLFTVGQLTTTETPPEDLVCQFVYTSIPPAFTVSWKD